MVTFSYILYSGAVINLMYLVGASFKILRRICAGTSRFVPSSIGEPNLDSPMLVVKRSLFESFYI